MVAVLVTPAGAMDVLPDGASPSDVLGPVIPRPLMVEGFVAARWNSLTPLELPPCRALSTSTGSVLIQEFTGWLQAAMG